MKDNRRLAVERLEPRYALAGDLDLTFGSGGVAEFAESLGWADETPTAMALQPDGKMLVGGITDGAMESIALARFNVDGSLDATFGDGGTVHSMFSGAFGGDRLRELVLQPDGRIVIGGFSGIHGFLARYQADGSIDHSFGDDGILHVRLSGENLIVTDVDLVDDGRYLVTGQNMHGYAVVLLNSDGSFATEFGNGDGYVRASSLSQITGTFVQSTGRIVVVGPSVDGTGWWDFRAVGLLSDGSVDSTFGTGGTQDIHFEHPQGFAMPVANLGASDEIVVASIPATGTVAVALLEQNGSLDSDFGKSGVAIGNFPVYALDSVTSVAVDENGSVFAGVVARSAVHRELGLVNFRSDGQINDAFGDAGVELYRFSSAYFPTIVDLTFVEGAIVAAASVGQTIDAETTRLGVTRIHPNGQLDSAFGDRGKSFAVVVPELLMSEAAAAVLQPDGKVVVLDSKWYDRRVLRRWNADGSLDQTYGNGGQVNLTMQGLAGQTLAVQSDGKLLVAGGTFDNYTMQGDAVVSRLNLDGSLDTSFGDSGTVTLERRSIAAEWVQRLKVGSDGSILVGAGGRESLVFHRLLPSGAIDPSFAGGDGVYYSPDGLSPQLLEFSVLPDGRIQFVSLNLTEWYAQDHIVVGTLLPNGSYDPNFGSPVVAPVEGLFVGTVAWQSDDGLLLGGGTMVDEIFYSAIVRLNPDGQLDRGFGNQGWVLLGPDQLPTRSVISLQVLPDDRFVALEETEIEALKGLQISAFFADGSIDPNFGSGATILELGPYSETALTTLLVSPSKMLIVGERQTGVAQAIFIAKANISELPWTNPINALNVDGDDEGTVTPLDALIVINAINSGGAGYLGIPSTSPLYFLDVDGDSYLTPLDALIVINWLNANQALPLAGGFDLIDDAMASNDDGEGEAFSDEEAVESHDKLDPLAGAMLLAHQDEREKLRRRLVR